MAPASLHAECPPAPRQANVARRAVVGVPRLAAISCIGEDGGARTLGDLITTIRHTRPSHAVSPDFTALSMPARGLA
jgi:hypothetical protein